MRQFYGQHFIGKWPEDVEITPVSRTVGENQVVDELVLSFTHDIEMPQLLPGVAATGRHVRLAFCVVVGFEDGKVSHEHIYWDQASLLGTGRTDRSDGAPGHRPRAGRERARPSCPSTERADARQALASSGAMRKDLPTGTVTFLFTDIEGSTRLLHSLGPDAYAEALAEHRRVLREAFAAHGGVEVDTQGDAFFVAFPTAEGAAAAALAAQEALAAGPISVRMGLHTGTPTVTGEGYVGVDVHRGARVAALAHGGQIVLSPATAALLDGAPASRPRPPPAQGLRGRGPPLAARRSTSSRRFARPGASTSRRRRRASSAASGSSSTRSRSSTSAIRAC